MMAHAEGCALVYRFGDFALDRDTRQLIVDGGEVHLSPKAFELLVMLLANRRRAVSKAELQQQLWPSTFVEETNLAGLVVEIRRALRDAASRPTFVRTVYGFGYRFVGDVTEGDGPPPSSQPLATPCLIVDNHDVILMEGANIIGRAADASISIDARGVSRHHARVLLSHGEATLEDLGSKNGTHLNGNRLTTAVRLSDGDEIRLGAISLRFRMARPMNPTETVAEWNR
jgi:DNA-binding winged helix-turn-helix (wHTH) protein